MSRIAAAALAAALTLCACAEQPVHPSAEQAIRIVKVRAFAAPRASLVAAPPAPVLPDPAPRPDPAADALEASQTAARSADPYRLSGTVLADDAG